MKPVAKAHIAVLFTNLFFAVNYSFVKNISPSLIGPYAINVMRASGSVLLFWLLWVFAKEKRTIHRSDMGRLALCGFLGVALNQILFIKGLTMTTAIHASLLSLCAPILITLLAAFWLGERLTLVRLSGLLLGVLGSIWLIAGRPSKEQPEGYLLGDILIVINAISYAFYFILVRPLMDRYTPLQVVRWVFTFGFLFILPVGWHQLTLVNWSRFTPEASGILFFIVVAATFLGYVFNAYGIRVLGPGVTSAYIYVQLVFAVAIAAIFFGEVLTAQKIFAGILILGGVWLVSRRGK